MREQHSGAIKDSQGALSAQKQALQAQADDPRLAPILQHLHRAEPSMRVRLRVLVRGRLRYRIHRNHTSRHRCFHRRHRHYR